jgi:uncharacterized protein YllA (UPF0747 family)
MSNDNRHFTIIIKKLLLKKRPKNVLHFSEKNIKDIDKLKLSISDFLSKDIKIIEGQYYKNNEAVLPSEIYLEGISNQLQGLKPNIADLPNNLQGSIVKQFNEFETQLKKIKKEINTHKTSQHEINLGKIQKIHKSIYPNNNLQEREDNLIHYYMTYGEDFIQACIDNFNPLNKQLHVFSRAV